MAPENDTEVGIELQEMGNCSCCSHLPVMAKRDMVAENIPNTLRLAGKVSTSSSQSRSPPHLVTTESVPKTFRALFGSRNSTSAELFEHMLDASVREPVDTSPIRRLPPDGTARNPQPNLITLEKSSGSQIYEKVGE
jgi:hypothetical protein